MKKLLILAFWYISLPLFAQKNTAGTVIYERESDFTKRLQKATYLSKEEKDRIQQTWKNDYAWKQKMLLTFNADLCHYTYQNEQETSEDGTYTWTNDPLIFTRDFAKGSIYEIQTILNKKYILEDSLRPFNWKILNEIKEIAGYLCMKATAHDPLTKSDLVAWFSMDIPIASGPERYYGLPGLILEVNVDDGSVLITASSVKMDPAVPIPALPKKIKGKKITISDYNSLVANYLSQQEKMHEMPWSLRF